MLNSLFSDESKLIVIPIIAGAYLSGIFYLVEDLPVPLTIFQISLLLGIFIFIVRKLVYKDSSFEIYGLEFQYLLLFTIIYLSIIYVPEREGALFYSVRFGVLIFLSYLLLNAIRNRAQFEQVIISIVVIAVITALVSLIHSLLNPDLVALNYLSQGRTLIRESGAETDPNIFASNFIIPSMLLFAGTIKLKSLKWKVIAFIGLQVILLAVLTTYSRSVWISIFIGLLIIIIRLKKYELIAYGFLLIVITIILVPEVRPFFLSILERIKDIFAGKADDSSNIRILLGIGAVKMILDTYLFGVGFQGFSSAFQEYYTIQETLGIYEPHNIFYTIFAELGIFGFIVFMMIIWRVFKASYRVSKIKGDEFLSTIGLAFYSSFISYLIFYQFYGGLTNSFLYILIGLIFCLRKVVKSSVSRERVYSYLAINS